MTFQESVLLAPYTTFKVGGPAKYFCIVKDQFDALEAYEFADKNNCKTFVLGGGSNILVSDEGFDGLVLKIENKGIEVVKESENNVLLRVASGENWDQFVGFAVKNNWWGIENLSHIPGSTGAIAVQNVGAYGQEAKNVIESVTVFDRNTHQILTLNNDDCGFEYRKSIFNSIAKGKYIIFNITFRLLKNSHANISYRDLALKFKESNPTINQIREAVVEIRNKKFPFPTTAEKGNAGSFFKNPILTEAVYVELFEKVKNIFGQESANLLSAKMFNGENKEIKIPAAFLIDLCGLKSMQNGGAAINENQPLVIINKTGKATATEVLELANIVREKVYEKTGILLNFEPELIGFN